MTTRRQTLAALLAALAVSPNAAAQDKRAAARAALQPGGAVETALDALAREDRFSGAVLGAIDGEAVLAKAWGMANRERAVANRVDTRFNIASCGKMFTAVAVGQLIERGSLSLDDRVLEHAPDLPAHLGALSITQLLSHTSGLGNFFASPNWQARGASIRSVNDYLSLVVAEQIPADYDGGFRYSNSGYVVLGAVIERIARADYYDVVRERVFAPAGMTRTGFPLGIERADDLAVGYENGCFMRPPSQCTPRAWAPAVWPGRGGPGGGSSSTVGDLNGFITALRDGRLISPATLDLFKAAHTTIAQPGGPIAAYGYGFGSIDINGRPTWGHNGGTIGAGAQVDVLDDAGLTLIVLSNQDGAMRAALGPLRQAAPA